jgi:hypothetical protein
MTHFPRPVRLSEIIRRRLRLYGTRRNSGAGRSLPYMSFINNLVAVADRVGLAIYLAVMAFS